MVNYVSNCQRKSWRAAEPASEGQSALLEKYAVKRSWLSIASCQKFLADSKLACQPSLW